MTIFLLISLLLLLLLLWHILPLSYAFPTSANMSTTWINNFSMPGITFHEGHLRPIFVSPSSSSTRDPLINQLVFRYAFGFYCSDINGISPCQLDTYLLTVMVVTTDDDSNEDSFMTLFGSDPKDRSGPQLVWYPNPFHPVRNDANLIFASGGQLLLSDADGTLIWSSNTNSNSKSKGLPHLLSLQYTGNLVVADAISIHNNNNSNSFLWQRLDHPTDTLLLGQTLRSGMNLSSIDSYVYVYMGQTNLTIFSTVLGSGGFGSVFLGVLADGSEVAVKRLENAKQGQKEFRAEVCIIGSIHHLNLVRLRGFCAEKDCHRLLVYEYMPNGSLERWLFRRNNSDQANDAGNINPVLDWESRLNIALGTARGLAYLHEECSDRIIHLDIKPHNILLDSHFVAKVSDFGLSTLMNREQSHVVTTMRGTPGYLAPEWLHTTTIAEKADVYSFGILLFEIASGRKCIDMSAEFESEVRHIPMWASRMVEEGRLMHVMDARLLGELKVEEAERMVKVALWCIQESPSKRPSMGTVVQMLEGVVECPLPPLNDSHILRTTDQCTHRISTGNQGYNSHNAMGSSPLAHTLSGPR